MTADSTCIGCDKPGPSMCEACIQKTKALCEAVASTGQTFKLETNTPTLAVNDAMRNGDKEEGNAKA